MTVHDRMIFEKLAAELGRTNSFLQRIAVALESGVRQQASGVTVEALSADALVKMSKCVTNGMLLAKVRE